MEKEYQDLLDAKGQIKPEKVEDLLCEVVIGRLVFTVLAPKPLFDVTQSPARVYACKSPTAYEHDQARIRYTKKLAEARSLGLPTRSELESMGMIDPVERSEKERLTKLLHKIMEGRDKTTDPRQKLNLDSEIEKLRDRIIKIEMSEMAIFSHSAESRAEEARLSYMVYACTLGGELLDERVWATFKEFQDCSDTALLDAARRAYLRVSVGLPITIIRALTRTQEWRMRWKGARDGGSTPFPGSSSEWDTNKLNMVYWSKFYDSVYEHPECPEQNVIENDDMLQQWLNQQIAKRKGKRVPSGNQPNSGGNWNRNMQKVGNQQIMVNTPYKIRTPDAH